MFCFESKMKTTNMLLYYYCIINTYYSLLYVSHRQSISGQCHHHNFYTMFCCRCFSMLQGKTNTCFHRSFVRLNNFVEQGDDIFDYCSWDRNDFSLKFSFIPILSLVRRMIIRCPYMLIIFDLVFNIM